MYAVEFDTSIHRGIVHIPVEHHGLHEQRRARVLVMIDSQPNNRLGMTQATRSTTESNRNVADIDALEILLTKIHASLPPEIHSKSDDELRLEALRGCLL